MLCDVVVQSLVYTIKTSVNTEDQKQSAPPTALHFHLVVKRRKPSVP